MDSDTKATHQGQPVQVEIGEKESEGGYSNFVLIAHSASEFIIDFAQRLLGRSPGGPAKVSVLSSGLMGSLSGSAVANTATTGTFTIPLMRSSGFKPETAAGVEAAASSGGALVPFGEAVGPCYTDMEIGSDGTIYLVNSHDAVVERYDGLGARTAALYRGQRARGHVLGHILDQHVAPAAPARRAGAAGRNRCRCLRRPAA